MAGCDDAHRQFDNISNAEGKVGDLPDWTHVTGRSFWWIYQGRYEGLADAWRMFHAKGREAGATPAGAPGDIYVCDPEDHKDDPERLLTLLWIPVQ